MALKWRMHENGISAKNKTDEEVYSIQWINEWKMNTFNIQAKSDCEFWKQLQSDCEFWSVTQFIECQKYLSTFRRTELAVWEKKLIHTITWRWTKTTYQSETCEIFNNWPITKKKQLLNLNFKWYWHKYFVVILFILWILCGIYSL